MKHEPTREPVTIQPANSGSGTDVKVTWWTVKPCACKFCRARAAGRRAVRKYARALERLGAA